MKVEPNPWIDRFTAVSRPEVIRKKARRAGVVVDGLEGQPTGVAVLRMRSALEAIFVPTQRSCEIIAEVMEEALGHAQAMYADPRERIARAYMRTSDQPPTAPIVLTGPAGTGKTELNKAIARLLAGESKVQLDANHGPVPLVAVRSVSVFARATVASLLLRLASEEVRSGKSKMSAPELAEHCAHWQFLCGVCLLLVDELQFLAQSSTANTLVAKILLALSYVRVPYLVGANYSMIHRLMRRPQEERDRLLRRSVLLLPDAAGSVDWSDLLREYQRTLPGVFAFDLVQQREALWHLTAGLKRKLLDLLLLAYRLARRQRRECVAWSGVEQAYCSMQFAPSREDVEALTLHGVMGSTVRADLRCPFPEPPPQLEEYNDSLRNARQARVARAVQNTVLTASERRARDQLNRELEATSIRQPAAVAPEPRPGKARRKSARSLEAMKRAAAEFR